MLASEYHSGSTLVDPLKTELTELFSESARYNLEETTQMLLQPYNEDTYQIDGGFREFLNRKINHRRRIPTGLAVSSRVHEGSVYLQKDPRTCVTWSVVNALSVINADPSPRYVQALLNLTQLQQGLKPFIALSLLDRTSPIRVGVVNIKELPFESFAGFLKGNFDFDRAFIAGVSAKRYVGGDNITHSICLAGYKVTEAGFMDVQVADSQLGKVWIPLEHIIRSFAGDHMYSLWKVES